MENDPVSAIAGLWLLFGLSHAVLSSSRIRASLVARLGGGPFRLVYSVVALATFAALVSYYLDHRHLGGLLWPPVTGGTLYAVHALNVLAVVLVVCGVLNPSPAAVTGRTVVEPRGVQLITRHAVFMGIALWAIAHLAVMGFATDAVFLGGFVVFALLGGWHQDRRRIAAGDEKYRRFAAHTPFLPFAGRHTLHGLRTLSPAGVVLGLVTAGVLRALHVL